MRNKTTSWNTFPLPLPFSQSQLHCQFSLPPPCPSPSSAEGWGMGVVVSPSHVVSAAPSSSPSLCPCSSMRSLPRDTVLHELLRRGVLPRLQVGICSTMDLPGLQRHSCLTMVCPTGCREPLLQRLEHLLPLLLHRPGCLRSCCSRIISLLYPTAVAVAQQLFHPS